jgi:hypothetical protein
MKTTELTGIALDWAVAMADRVKIIVLDKQIVWPEDYAPSTDWAQGGPIIERERINVDPSPDSPEWYGYYDNHGKWHGGPTPLIAAMRCYVAAKLGDDIEIPEELK